MAYFEDNMIESVVERRRHYVFDMNGLILDDEPIQMAATNRAFDKFKLNIGEDDWRDRCVGRKPLDYLPSLLMSATSKEISDNEILQILVEKDVIYRELVSISGSSLLRTGIRQFMHHIRSSGAKISICTSTTSAGVRTVLENPQLDIGNFVDYIVCGDEVRKSKPNPEIYIKTCKKAGFSPSESIAFEDSFAGLQSAINAKLDCVACPNQFTMQQDFTSAAIVISDFAKTARHLEKQIL